MEARDYLRVLRTHWVLILVMTLLGAGVAGGLTAASHREYTARAKVFVSTAPSLSSRTSLADSSKFGLDRVKSYVQLADSELVLAPVIASLGLDMTVNRLAEKVSAQNPVDTLFLDVLVVDSNAARSADIANAVANQLGKVIDTLETPRSGAIAPVKVTVTRTATTPQSPTSPRPILNLALGIVVGLALGVALSVLRQATDTSVAGAKDVQEITGGLPLGSVAYSSDLHKAPLAALTPQSPASEAYRTIRTRLQFVDVEQPPRCFVVTAALPGQGKTVTACNLAITIAKSGARVCLVDADLRKPKIHTLFGLEGSIGLSNVLAGQYELDDLLVDWRSGLLSVLSAGTTPSDPSELLGSPPMQTLLQELRTRFHYVIFNAPPLLPVTDGAVLSQAVDGALVVVRNAKIRRDQLQRSVEILRQANARLLGTVITFAGSTKGERGYGYDESTTSATRTVDRTPFASESPAVGGASTVLPQAEITTTADGDQ